MPLFKKSLLTLCAFTVFFLTYSMQVSAQEKEKQGLIQVKIAIINIDAIRANAEVVKDIQRQIKTLRTEFQKDIQKEEEELRNANQELARQRGILSPEAFAQERKKFEQRLVEVQRLVQNRKQDLEKVRSDALRQVEIKLNKIVIDIANKQGITLVLRTEQLIFWAKPLEITGVVLKELNAVMSSLKVAVPDMNPKKK
ncbi:MAG: OmpH family outer membrane protein [Rhodospirillales bacterium]|nr:OmpH family outer membrane protein [Rhodospirillales bacterium]